MQEPIQHWALAYLIFMHGVAGVWLLDRLKGAKYSAKTKRWWWLVAASAGGVLVTILWPRVLFVSLPLSLLVFFPFAWFWIRDEYRNESAR